MRIVRFIAILITVALVGCANPIKVNSDYLEGTDFNQYKTYRWQDDANINSSFDEFLASDFIDGRLHTNVDTQLRSKGYVYREQGSVDFLVSYRISSEPRENLRSYGGGYYAPWWSVGSFNRHRSLGYGVGLHNAPRLTVDRYLYASLVLDMVDAESQQLIWRGKAERRIPEQQTSEKRRANLERVVAKLFKDFPSRP